MREERGGKGEGRGRGGGGDVGAAADTNLLHREGRPQHHVLSCRAENE